MVLLGLLTLVVAVSAGALCAGRDVLVDIPELSLKNDN